MKAKPKTDGKTTRSKTKSASINDAEHQRTLDALQESEARFSILFNKAPYAAQLANLPDGLIVDVNEAFEILIGYARDEAVGKSSVELNIYPDPEIRTHMVAEFKARGFAHNVETTLQTKAGDLRTVLVSSDLVEVAGEKHILTTTQDITERKQTEKKLKKQNQHLKILREIDTAILASDAVENIVGATLDHIRELIDCERANLALIDWEKNEAVNFDVRDTKESAIAKGARVSLDLIQDILHVLSQNQPVLMKDLTLLPDPPPQVKIFIKEGLRSRCILPLLSQGKLIGSFTLSSNIPDYFDEEKVNLAREVANQVAVAITQKHLVASLRTSEEKYSVIFDRSPFALTLTKMPEATIMGVNNAFMELFEFTRTEVIGKTSVELGIADPESRAKIGAEFQARGRVHDFEVTRNTKTGRRLDLALNLDWVTIGEEKYILTTIRDITERKQAEAQIEYQANLLKHINDAVIAVDHQFHITAWNHTAEIMYGWSAEEALGNLSTNVIRSEMTAEERQETLRQLHEHGMYRNEIIQYRKDGQPVYVEASTITLYDKDNQVTGLLSVNRDITERKQAEAALRLENERFQRFVESNIVGIVIANASGKVITANDYYLNLLGVTRQDFADEKVDWRKFTPPEWLSADEQAIQELRERGVCEPYEKEYERADGKRVPVYITDAMLPGPDGQIAAFVLDITARKQAENSIRLAEQQYRLLFEESPVMVVLTEYNDTNILIANCNQEFLATLGYDQAEVIGKSLTGFYSSDSRVKLKQSYLHTITGIPLSEERELITRDGRIVPVLLRAVPRANAEGVVIGTQASFIDITERKKVELAEREQRLLAESLRDTALILNSALDFEELLDRILENIERVAPFRAANITIVEDGVTRIVRTRHHSIVDAHDRPPNDPIPLDDLPTFKEMADSLLPLVVPDTSDDSRWSDIPGHGWIRSYIGVPIHKGETLIGFLNVNHDIPGFFTAQHAERLQAFAHHAAIALENARLFEQSQNEIAERKRAMEALRASEESLRKAQHVAHVGSWTWHIRENRLEWSDEMYLIFGIDKDTFNASLPDVIARAIHPDDREAVERANILVIQKNTPMPFEYRVVWEDETIHTVWAEAGELILDEAGNPSLLTGIVQDITARKRAEEALRESEDRFRSHIQQANDYIFTLNPIGQITGVNRVMCETLGYAESELVGMSALELVAPDHRSQVAQTLQRIWNAESIDVFEVPIRPRMGETIFVQIRGRAIYKEGKLVETLHIARDVTEQIRAENELRLRGAALEAAVNAIVITDRSGTIEWVNSAYTRLTGYSMEEALGSNPRILSSGAQDKAFYKELWDTILAGKPWHGELINKRKDGSHYHEEQTITPLTDPSGQVIHFIAIKQDITERKQAEEKIQRQVEYLSALRDIDSVIAAADNMQASLNRLISHTVRLLNVDAATVLLVNSERGTLEYTDGFGFWTDAVLTASVKLGESYAGRAAVERRLIQIPNLAEEPENLFLNGFLEGEKFESYYGAPLIVNEKVIGVLQVFNRAAVVRDTEWLDFFNTLAGQAAIAIDHARLIDDLHRSNAELEQRVAQRTEELKKTNVELEHANRAKDEFLATMSHELRTPLNSILGLSETLLEQQRDPLSEFQQRYLQTIASSGNHLLELINDILDLSKIEAGKFDHHPQWVGVDDLCRSSLAFVKEQATRKSITLMYQQATPVSRVYADPRRLKQILVNLLTNAVKFTPEHGQVILQVTADAEQERIQFAVIDNGIGITPENMEKLFQPFVQIDSRLTREYEGTGLGLALVQKLTDLHGGSVDVESDGVPGKGSRFTINLPLGQAIPDQPPVHASESEQTKKGSTSTSSPVERAVILLAEDNTANILTIGDYLENHGYQVMVAHDGLEAIAKAEALQPNIILMDIQMPVLNGLESISRLRADPRFASTPIIALTALAMPGDRERCLVAGANEYMSKPVSLKALIKTIEVMLKF